ncbi:murein L,D-transpeptidase catalytic domain family protein [Hymenobacter gummosus]|nr:murein L,D-transpeptidase catalytic domain family protein [Hymenobacter gummosus]
MRSLTTLAGLELSALAAFGPLTGCQSPAPGQAPTVASAVAPAAGPDPVPAAPPRPLVAKWLPHLPDSLQPGPVAALPGVPDSVHSAMQALQQQLGPAAATLRPAVLERAVLGYRELRRQGELRGPQVLAVADMELPSSEPRLWVIDLKRQQLLLHSHVTHGRGSGGLRARRFSDRLKSACTALGFYRTGETYQGKHGLSRRLHGLDKGQNGHALRRYVVLHAADYASAAYLQQHGQLGNSRGCPALPPDKYRAVIGSLAAGSCLFIYAPEAAYTSVWLPADSAPLARR